ncbi:MAG: formylglycine-generating enzyme family protein [Candidatus Sumerlaeia bacterium]|nr:formylglycine-generating enzyme family protein [Candidatus Sumerlaeia bacterium]
MRLVLVCGFLLCAGLGVAAPQVSNVQAGQRPDGSGLVEVSYDLSGGVDPMTVFLHVSLDDGATWSVIPHPDHVSGDVGTSVGNGASRQIVWDAGTERPGVTWENARVRVTALEAIATAQERTILLPGDVPLTMVGIPGGTFLMGAAERNWTRSDEWPIHAVSIMRHFEMGKFELTREQWSALSTTTPWTELYEDHYEGLDAPANSVTYHDALEWIAALNAHVIATSQGAGTFRLPSEAEWEHAARAGTRGRFWFGDSDCPPSGVPEFQGYCSLMDHAWFGDNVAGLGAQAVGQKLPNPFGLYDMSGNVSEWCLDVRWTYVDTPIDGSAYGSPEDADYYRILRGGNFLNTPQHVRPASRQSNLRFVAGSESGFRLARDLEESAFGGWASGHDFSGSFTVDTVPNLDPPNEVWAWAEELTGLTGSVTGTTVGAVYELDEPLHRNNAWGPTVWYRWTPEHRGSAVFHTCQGSTYDTMLAVYTGESLRSLKLVTANDNSLLGDCGGVRSRVAFTANAGTTYYIVVGGAEFDAGDYTLTWLQTPFPPANDNFAGTMLIGHEGAVFGSTQYATRQGGEPAHAGESDSPSVWYSWNAPGPGLARFSTCNETGFNSVLDVYTGNAVSNLRRVPWTNEDCEELGSTITFTATTETTYRIAVAGNGTASGTFLLTWSGPETPPPPPNDDFADATVLPGYRGSLAGTTLGATRQANEPPHVGLWGYSSGSVWYRWTPPEDGFATIGTCAGADFDTVLAVYTGSSLGGLKFVAQDDDACPFGRSSVSFSARAESTYHVAVAGKGVASGSFVLGWDVQPPNPLDDAHEPNESWVLARGKQPLLVGDRIENLALYNEDWYRIAIGPEESVAVRVLFLHTEGNINAELYDLRVFDRTGWPMRVAESYSPDHPWVWNPAAGDGPAPIWDTLPWGPQTADDEWLTFINSTGATELFLRVYGEGNEYNPRYSVYVDSLGVDDAFEPNNALEQAATIARDVPYEWLIGRENDFYRVDTSGVEAIRVRLACYALLGTMYFEVHGVRPEDGTFGPLETSKMYEPNRYDAAREVCVSGQDEVFVRVYPAVRRANLYNLVVETLEECP